MFRTMLLAAAAAATLGATSGGAATFAYTGGFQQFTAGPAGLYRLSALGANGGGSPLSGARGGYGAFYSAGVPLAMGSRLDIAVGGVGRSAVDASAGGGGGGGTFILGAGRAPLVVAGGGGGGASTYDWASADGIFATNGHNAVLGTSGTSGGAGGAGGSAGAGGQSYFFGGAGGAGVFGNGQDAMTISELASATGGSGASGNFAGGLPSRIPGVRDVGGAGGFGGGGGGVNSADFVKEFFKGGGGGGGGGYSGGGGGGAVFYGGGGGGGGSFVTNAATNVSGLVDGGFPIGFARNSLDGVAWISLERTFAAGAVSTNAIDFGTVRSGSASVDRGYHVINAPPRDSSGNVYTTGDSLEYSTGALPSQVISGLSAGVLQDVNQTAFRLVSLSTAQPGVVSGNIAVNFASLAPNYLTETSSPKYVVEGATIAVTGIVTEAAQAGFFAGGRPATLFSTNPTLGNLYLVDLGDIVAGRRFTVPLSMANLIGASSYAERLRGYFILSESNAGFGLSNGFLQNFDVAGGSTALLGQLIAPQYVFGESYFEAVYSTTSHFDGLVDTPRAFTRLLFRANLIAGAAVPEPATWGLMIAGFGMIGAALRQRARVVA